MLTLGPVVFTGWEWDYEGNGCDKWELIITVTIWADVHTLGDMPLICSRCLLWRGILMIKLGDVCNNVICNLETVNAAFIKTTVAEIRGRAGVQL